VDTLKCWCDYRFETTEGEINKIEPYLFFDGRCEEAIEFYEKALGAEFWHRG
jgi:hypothetical protein